MLAMAGLFGLVLVFSFLDIGEGDPAGGDGPLAGGAALSDLERAGIDLGPGAMPASADGRAAGLVRRTS